jgi:hypothetical protein
MQKNEEIPIVYPKKEVARIFRISVKRLNVLINTGKIKIIDLAGKIMIPRSEIERILGADLRYVDLSGLGVRIKRKSLLIKTGGIRVLK